jgi:hypothetical protein
LDSASRCPHTHEPLATTKKLFYIGKGGEKVEGMISELDIAACNGRTPGL